MLLDLANSVAQKEDLLCTRMPFMLDHTLHHHGAHIQSLPTNLKVLPCPLLQQRVMSTLLRRPPHSMKTISRVSWNTSSVRSCLDDLREYCPGNLVDSKTGL